LMRLPFSVASLTVTPPRLLPIASEDMSVAMTSNPRATSAPKRNSARHRPKSQCRKRTLELT
jgi:hypothetical protein